MKYPAQRLLVIATRQLGDVLLTTALLRSLRHAYPNATIDVLVYSGKSAMLTDNPDIDGVIDVAEHPNLTQYRQLLGQIFRRYDLAISTLTGDRPHIYAWLAARTRVSVVPPRRWQDSWKRWLSTAWTEFDNWDTHTVLQNLKLADALAIPRSYGLVAPAAAGGNTAGITGLDLQRDAFAVLHLTPLLVYKRWHRQGWTQLGRYLHDRGLRLVLTGGNAATERDYIDGHLTALPDDTINLAGRLSLTEVAGVLRHCRLYVGPDTAVTHLAAACGAPTIALFGPTNPVKWAPWPARYSDDRNPFQRRARIQVRNNVALLQGPGECVPCHNEGCEGHRQSYSRCLDELSADDVIAAVQQLIG